MVHTLLTMDKGMPPPAARPPSLFGSDMRRQVLAQRDSAAGLGPLRAPVVFLASGMSVSGFYGLENLFSCAATIEDDAPITIMPPRGAAGAGTSGARDEDMPDWSRYFTDRLNLRIEGCGRFRCAHTASCRRLAVRVMPVRLHRGPDSTSGTLISYAAAGYM